MKNNNKIISGTMAFSLCKKSFSLGLRFEILVTIRLLEDPCVLGLCTGRKQDWEED